MIVYHIYIYNGILMTNDDLTFSSETQAIFGHIPMIPWDPPPWCLVPQNGVPPAHARRCTLALATRHRTGHGDCWELDMVTVHPGGDQVTICYHAILDPSWSIDWACSSNDFGFANPMSGGHKWYWAIVDFPKTPLWTLGDKGSEFLSMNSFACLQGLRVGYDVENYVKLPLL